VRFAGKHRQKDKGGPIGKAPIGKALIVTKG
jgi:hypothetical protein